ncbi:hypothetical protein GGF50DRAFT_118745 [Schizophyllum commune]
MIYDHDDSDDSGPSRYTGRLAAQFSVRRPPASPPHDSQGWLQTNSAPRRTLVLARHQSSAEANLATVNARSTIKTRTPEACALAQQLGHAVTDSAALSFSRQLDWQLASAICKSSTPSASLDMSCKLNDFSFTLMTLPRLQLHLNHSPLSPDALPSIKALKQ